MNRLSIVLVGSLLIVVSCGGFRQMGKKPWITVTPEKVGLFVNQQSDPYIIQVDYTLNVPAHYVPACGRLIWQPYFTGNGQRLDLTPVIITGKEYVRREGRLEALEGQLPDYPGIVPLMTKKGTMNIKLSQAVPFQLWMTQAKLMAGVSLEACDRKTELYELTLADGVVYIPQDPGPVRVKYIQKEIEKNEEGFARFLYPVNGYVVDPAIYRNRQELDDMTNMIKKVMTDSSMHVLRIVVTGICSPDGPYIYNESLAKRRAESVEKYLEVHGKVDPGMIEMKYIPEDWDGLRKLLGESTMPGKKVAIGIIDRIGHPDQREAELRKLPQFNYIKQNFYPQLRKVTYEIYYTVKEMVEEVIPE